MDAFRSIVDGAPSHEEMEALVAVAAARGMSERDVLRGVLLLVCEALRVSCVVLAVILPAGAIRAWPSLDGSSGFNQGEADR